MRRKKIAKEVTKNHKLPQIYIQKSHHLVFSQLQMPRRSQDMFALFLARLQQDKEVMEQDFENDTINIPTYIFSSEHLSDWFGVKPKTLYHLMKPIADQLTDQKIGVFDDERMRFKFINLFDTAEFVNGKIKITPTVGILPYMVNYSKGYSQVKHKPFRALKGSHAKRIYEILSRFKKQYQKIPAIKIDEMQAMLGLRNVKNELISKSYKNTSMFIKNCISSSIQEMQSCPEVSQELQFETDPATGTVGYRSIKEGRKIIAIEFLYHWRKAEKQITPQENELQETLLPQTENHILNAYREGWNVVMCYPSKGELSDKHLLAFQAVELGMLTTPEDMPYSLTFQTRVKRIIEY